VSLPAAATRSVRLLKLAAPPQARSAPRSAVFRFFGGGSHARHGSKAAPPRPSNAPCPACARILFAEDAWRRNAFFDSRRGPRRVCPVSLGELTGELGVRGGKPMDPPVLESYPKLSDTRLGPAAEVGGYLILVCLPKLGGRLHRKAQRRARRRARGARLPGLRLARERGEGLDFAYFLDEHERILMADSRHTERVAWSGGTRRQVATTCQPKAPKPSGECGATSCRAPRCPSTNSEPCRDGRHLQSDLNRDVPMAQPSEFAPLQIGAMRVWPPVVLAPFYSGLRCCSYSDYLLHPVSLVFSASCVVSVPFWPSRVSPCTV